MALLSSKRETSKFGILERPTLAGAIAVGGVLSTINDELVVERLLEVFGSIS
jgi:hypothetical protein